MPKWITTASRLLTFPLWKPHKAWSCQNVWCSWMVCSNHDQAENLNAEAMGTELIGMTQSQKLSGSNGVELDLPIKLIPRRYFDQSTQVAALQLHGFSDASQNFYAAVVYLRIIDTFGKTQVSLVSSKTKVAPIKKLTIPWLELCGAYLLTQLLFRIKNVFNMPLNSVYTWTDSTIVLNWLIGNPRRFKIYVGNQVSSIVELIAPEMESRWRHWQPSRLCFKSKVSLWTPWTWLVVARSQLAPPTHFPSNSLYLLQSQITKTTLYTVSSPGSCLLNISDYSSFARLKWVPVWILRFTQNCCSCKLGTEPIHLTYLTTQELYLAELHLCSEGTFHEWNRITQEVTHWQIKSNLCLPFINSVGQIRVGGRQQHSNVLLKEASNHLTMFAQSTSVTCWPNSAHGIP